MEHPPETHGERAVSRRIRLPEQAPGGERKYGKSRAQRGGGSVGGECVDPKGLWGALSGDCPFVGSPKALLAWASRKRLSISGRDEVQVLDFVAAPHYKNP